MNTIDHVLGKATKYPIEFDPSVLVPIPRSENREKYGIKNDELVGFDIWNCYESSFTTDNGYPVNGVLQLRVPSSTKFIVESKSLKLFLFSLNNHQLGATPEEAIENYEGLVEDYLSKLLCGKSSSIVHDERFVQARLFAPYALPEPAFATPNQLQPEAEPRFELYEPSSEGDDELFYHAAPIEEVIWRQFHASYSCAEDAREAFYEWRDETEFKHEAEDPLLLRRNKSDRAFSSVEAALNRIGYRSADKDRRPKFNRIPPVTFLSDVLRSNCRITHQPDFGTVYISIEQDPGITVKEGPIDFASIQEYLISFRQESHFHEEVVEMIYKRLLDTYKPLDLTVAALYTRRGGIDIWPVRAMRFDSQAYPHALSRMANIKLRERMADYRS